MVRVSEVPGGKERKERREKKKPQKTSKKQQKNITQNNKNKRMETKMGLAENRRKKVEGAKLDKCSDLVDRPLSLSMVVPGEYV